MVFLEVKAQRENVGKLVHRAILQLLKSKEEEEGDGCTRSLRGEKENQE